MVLHTIIPLEQIFGSKDSINQDSINYEYRRTGNHFVQGVSQDGRFMIERLIATDPSLYLNPKYAPGRDFKAP